MRESGPDIDHIGDDGVPLVIECALSRRFKRQFVVVRQLLAVVSRMLAGEFGNERPNRNAIRFFVPHGGRITIQPFGISSFHLGHRLHSIGDGCRFVFIRHDDLSMNQCS